MPFCPKDGHHDFIVELREKSLADIELAKQQGKYLGRPTGRDAEKLAKVDKGLLVAEIVTLTGVSRTSVKRYRQELATN